MGLKEFEQERQTYTVETQSLMESETNEEQMEIKSNTTKKTT